MAIGFTQAVPPCRETAVRPASTLAKNGLAINGKYIEDFLTIAKKGGCQKRIASDITEKSQVDAKFAGDGKIDVLISNEDIIGPQVPVKDADSDNLLDAIHMNLPQRVLACRTGFENPAVSVYHVQPGVVDTDMNEEAGGVKAIGFEDHFSLPASFLRGRFLWANWDVGELKARSKEIEENPRLSIGLVGYPFGEGNWKLNWST